MSGKRLLLVDDDPKNIKILRESFSLADFDVDFAPSDLEAYTKIETNPPDVIVTELSPPKIDGYRLLEQVERNPKTADVPVIFLTKKSDVWNRVKSFKLGAKDYIVKPLHVKEIVARINMVLNRIEKRKMQETEVNRKLSGRLEDLSVIDLIEKFGIERKTCVLTVSNENGKSGHIFFNNGAVINANCDNKVAEDAIYQMVPWQKGRFSVILKKVEVPDDIPVSNLGLLMQAAKRMECRGKLLDLLPPLNSVLVTTVNFKKIAAKKDLASDLEKFLGLFDGVNTLSRVIDASEYDDLTTLERINKLFKLGFLTLINEENNDASPEIPIEKEEFDLIDRMPEESPKKDKINKSDTTVLLKKNDHFQMEKQDSSENARELLPKLDKAESGEKTKPIQPEKTDNALVFIDKDNHDAPGILPESDRADTAPSKSQDFPPPYESILDEKKIVTGNDTRKTEQKLTLPDTEAGEPFSITDEFELAKSPLPSHDPVPEPGSHLPESGDEFATALEIEDSFTSPKVTKQDDQKISDAIFDDNDDSREGMDAALNQDKIAQIEIRQPSDSVDTTPDAFEEKNQLEPEPTIPGKPFTHEPKTEKDVQSREIDFTPNKKEPERPFLGLSQDEDANLSQLIKEVMPERKPGSPQAGPGKKLEADKDQGRKDVTTPSSGNVEQDTHGARDQDQIHISSKPVKSEPATRKFLETGMSGIKDLQIGPSHPGAKPVLTEIKQRPIKPGRLAEKSNILIVANEENVRRRMIAVLTEGAYITHRLGGTNLTDIYLGMAQFKGGHSLNILGISVEREFAPVVDYLCSKILGYILLINANDIKNWNYYGYLANTLRSKLNIPSLVLIYHDKEDAGATEEQIRTRLGLLYSSKIEFIKEINQITAKRAIFALFGAVRPGPG